MSDAIYSLFHNTPCLRSGFTLLDKKKQQYLLVSFRALGGEEGEGGGGEGGKRLMV
jgi:hypothetical protein